MSDDERTAKMLKKLIGKVQSESSDSMPATKLSLSKLCELYLKNEKLKAGDIVQFKEGMKHTKFPKYGQNAVVVEILTSPIFDNDPNKSGTSYWNEKNDVRLGVMEDGNFSIHHFDSRRFEKVKKK